MRNFLHISILLIFSHSIIAQREYREEFNEDIPLYFGFETSLILPYFVNQDIISLADSMYSSESKFKTGYVLGGIIRRDLDNGLSFEGGIKYTQRHLNVRMQVADSAIDEQNNITFINYELPIATRVYVKLTESFYGHAGIGISTVFKPTNIRVNNYTDSKSNFVHYGYVKSKFGFDLNAQFGFEIKTRNSGFFQFGASVKIPFTALFEYNGLYFYGTQLIANDWKNINGSFFAFDLKYYLPKISNAGRQPLINPIE